jgi:hypothetical protein
MVANLTHDEFKMEALRYLFNGRLVRIDKVQDLAAGGYYLSLVLHVPDDEGLDELEVYRRLRTVVNTVSSLPNEGA